MEKEAKATGTSFISEDELNKHEEVIAKRTFTEVMNEAKEIWISTIDKGKTEEEKENYLNTMRSVVGKIFGNSEFKLSQAIPQQQDLVELFIDEMKDIIQ